MHLNGIAKRITALALGAALLTATALPAFAEGTQKVTYTAGNYTFEKISPPRALCRQTASWTISGTVQ